MYKNQAFNFNNRILTARSHSIHNTYKLAESQVLAGSVTSPSYKRFNWDLTEITRYKEEKCFYQNLLPQNDNDNISSAQSIGSSTPFKMHTTDSLMSMQDKFKTFKEKIESTVTLLVNKMSQQTQIIEQNKQEICKLTNDNLHLKSRVADLELKIFPKKDESIILIKSSENTNITHNHLENTSQPVV